MRKEKIPTDVRIGDMVEFVVDDPDSAGIMTGDIATVVCYDRDESSPYAFGVAFEEPSDDMSLHSLWGCDDDGKEVNIVNNGFWVKPAWISRIDDSWIECDQPDLGELF